MFGGIDFVHIRHQEADRGGTFVGGALPVGAVWRLYTPGEIMRVVGLVRATGTFAFLPQQWTHPHDTAAILELEAEMPMQTQGIEGPWTITVDVDRTLLPTATQTDALSPVGTNVPDGWRLYNAVSIAADEPGQLVPSRLNIVASGTDPFAIGTTDACLEKTLPPEIVEAYRGFDLRAAFWVQQHYSAAVWGSTSNFRVEFAFNEDPYLLAADVAVPVTFLDGVGSGGALDATEVSNTVRVPVDARTCRIRLRAGGTIALNNFTVEK